MSRQPPNTQQTQPPAPDQRGTDKEPLAVKILPSQKTKEEADREEGERKEKANLDKSLVADTWRLADETERLSTYTQWLMRFTLAIFAAAVVQAAFFYWQLRLIKETTQTNAIIARAARDSADAARSQAEETRLSQRAYLSVERDGIRPNAVGDAIIGHVIIRNVGQRPASNVSWFVKVTSTSDAKFVPAASDTDESTGSAVVFPEAAIPGASAMTAICTDKTGFLYVSGVVSYSDAAMGDVRLWTKFCHRYNRTFIKPARNGGITIAAVRGRYHESGNDYK